MNKPKYKKGEKVICINDNGVNLGKREIINIELNCSYSESGIGYYIKPTDSPWFAVKEECLYKIITDYEKVMKELKLKKNEIDNHEIDLYIKYTPEREKQFLKLYPFYEHISKFKSEIDHSLWMDIPFFLIDDKINKANTVNF